MECDEDNHRSRSVKTNIMRSVALALGFSVATVAQAQYNGYPAAPGYAQPQQPASTVPVHPSLQPNPGAQAWNNYRPPAGQVFRTASTGSGYAPQAMPDASLPAPQGAPAYGQPTPAHGTVTYSGSAPDSNCTSCNGPQVGQVYTHAAAAPWAGEPPIQYGAPMACAPAPMVGPAPLRNWFGGANLLFLDLEENCDRRLLFDSAMPLGTALSTGQVDPSSNVAFETFFGRYFNCGQHALMANYFFFDPTSETARVDAGAGANGRNMNVNIDYRAAMPSWNNIMYDVGQDGMPGNDVAMYTLYEGDVRYRTSRDVAFQGIELNLISFGLGGARRAACGPLSTACSGGCGVNGACGGNCGPTPGCGGACGPMVPPCGTKLQIQTTHGLRWFQFKDSFEFATSQTDTTYGNTADDLYYNVDTQNNLFGYQFGARLDYCLGHKLNVYAGTKMGIYANDAQFRSRLGTAQTAGYVSNYYPTIQGQAVVVDNSETVLATLGELDLGLGYRINNCWSVRGGYRLYGISGVATSVGSIAEDLANLPEAGKVCADQSLLLQGGYIGAEYNW